MPLPASRRAAVASATTTSAPASSAATCRRLTVRTARAERSPGTSPVRATSVPRWRNERRRSTGSRRPSREASTTIRWNELLPRSKTATRTVGIGVTLSAWRVVVGHRSPCPTLGVAARGRQAAGRRGVAQLGSAPALGAGGPRFESGRPDHRPTVDDGTSVDAIVGRTGGRASGPAARGRAQPTPVTGRRLRHQVGRRLHPGGPHRAGDDLGDVGTEAYFWPISSVSSTRPWEASSAPARGRGSGRW